MDEPPPALAKKKTKSDVIAHATIEEWLKSHGKPNGGLKSFFHSNLFAALLLWILSQAVVVGGFIISFYMKTSQLYEWKGQTDAVIKRMDEQGTIYGRFANDKQSTQITALESQMKHVEDDSRQFEVIKTEHRRLTQDVEELRHGKK